VLKNCSSNRLRAKTRSSKQLQIPPELGFDILQCAITLINGRITVNETLITPNEEMLQGKIQMCE
jgi:hypothetical protein